jgi:hypothetical protein
VVREHQSTGLHSSRIQGRDMTDAKPTTEQFAWLDEQAELMRRYGHLPLPAILKCLMAAEDELERLRTPSVSPSAEAREHAENLRETAGFMRDDGLPHAAQELDDAATFIERTPSHPLQGAVTEEKIKEAALRAARRHSGNATRNDVYEEGFVAGANFITAALQSPAKEGKE